MLGLWLWWLEWACKDAHFSVFNFLNHLRMREVLVEDNTFNELTIRESTTGFGNNFNQIKVDIFSLQISNMKD